MFNFLRTSAVAAIVAVAPLAASAATVELVDGGSDVIDQDDVYVGLIDNPGTSPGFWQFKFIADFDQGATALATISPRNLDQFTGLTIGWYAADGAMINAPITVEDMIAGNNTLATNFVGPDSLSQYLRFEWDTSTGIGGFDIEVDLAAVPVPAAGLMLLTALGGAAAMRRRAKA